jgi:hypothetical protein
MPAYCRSCESDLDDAALDIEDIVMEAQRNGQLWLAMHERVLNRLRELFPEDTND